MIFKSEMNIYSLKYYFFVLSTYKISENFGILDQKQNHSAPFTPIKIKTTLHIYIV